MWEKMFDLKIHRPRNLKIISLIKNQHECENESSGMEKEMIEEGDILELEPVMVPSGNCFFLYLNILLDILFEWFKRDIVLIML